MKSEFEKTFEQLADFHTIGGYDGWMIGSCVYEQRGAGKRDRSSVAVAEPHILCTESDSESGLNVVENQEWNMKNSCKSEIVKETASFAVMRNQLELEGMHYQLELHVVKPEVQETLTSKQAGMEENMGMNVEKSKLEEQRMNLHHSVETEETADTGGGKTFSFTHSDILRFVDAVGDTNSIHRTAHAVVPGLLMVERMLDMWMKKQPKTETDVELQAGMKNETQAGVQTETENEMQTDMQNSREFICRFRFEKPVFVDEKLQVEARTERGKQIYECKREDREIVWNMRIL